MRITHAEVSNAEPASEREIELARDRVVSAAMWYASVEAMDSFLRDPAMKSLLDACAILKRLDENA